MRLIEKIILMLFVGAGILKILHLQGANMILVISLSSLALVYLPGGYFLFKNPESKKKNLPYSLLAGFALSITSLAFLFSAMHWPGATIMLKVGILATLSAFIIGFYLKSKAKGTEKNYYHKIILRLGIMMAIFITIFLIWLSNMN